jgi:hypothetical protein
MGKASNTEDTEDVFLFPPECRIRLGSTSSLVSNSRYSSAQGSPQNGRGAQITQINAVSQIEKECDNIDNVLLRIKVLVKEMTAKTGVQKNINQIVKNGIVEIGTAAGAIFEHGTRIREIAQSQLSKLPEKNGRLASSNINKRARDATINQEDTPSKKSRKESKEENEWQLVTSQRRKQTAPAERDTERNDAAPAEEKRPKVRKKRDVVLIQPGAEKTYAEILGTLKEKMNPEESGAVVKSVRKTQNGAVLLELGKETTDKEAFRRSIQEAIGNAGQVRSPVSTTTLEIWDLDCLTTKEDVQQVLVQETGKNVDFKVHVFEPNSREQKMALATANAETATLLLKKGRIKIGWMNCRIRQRLTVTRCHRCLGYGHIKANCNGKDRSMACWKCGKDGHKANRCSSRPDTQGCFLCSERPEIKDKAHFPGSGSCSVFRAALAQQKRLFPR